MKKLQPKIFIDTEVSLETGYNISTGYSIGQVIHFNDTGKEYYHCTNGTWKEYGSPAKDTYSYDEKIIGEWVNGKPIYRKVFLLDTSNIDIFIGHNLSIDTYIHLDLVSNFVDGRNSPSTPLLVGLNGLTEISASENIVGLYGFLSESTYTYHLILEYTKLP